MTVDRYHLIAVTADLTHAVGGRTAVGWLLPSIAKAPYGQLPSQVRDALQQIVGATEDVRLVHEAPLAAEGATEAKEYYFAAGLTHPRGAAAASGDAGDSRATAIDVAGGGATLLPLGELLSTRALLPCQRDALATALSRMREPIAAFDSVSRVADAIAWATRQIKASTGARVTQVEPHRCMRHEYVVRLRTESGETFYFKGGPERVEDEARTTQLLAVLCPRVVPDTVAIDEVNHRWLYRELAGELLIGERLTIETAITAVRALARVQKVAMTSPLLRAHLSRRALTIGAAIEDADARIDVDLPGTLVLSDFWGRNIVLQPDREIGFIDLERSYWGSPILPLWQFLRDVERTLDARSGDAGAGVAARERIECAFVEEWADVVPVAAMRAALAQLPVLGREFARELAAREREIRARELGANEATLAPPVAPSGRVEA